ncbi:Ribosomal protein S18 acetylase RimI [Methylomagnum ishizawai]|uniref:Ribosomal protein S18 acetylase RimI n=1 Tax=Methylomagnum ishizawai TaxID=1760988 RepID=A0A1Y6D365_9GAMM|nr:GNAT family N-acetyltransferase [Methylomagnum ishizawai]SMF97041.1 Ribosomal protein S18 acetylase RimI [Methylomagnum ishizawai]
MTANCSIQRAAPHDAPLIAPLVGELLREIMAAIDLPAFNFDLAETTARLEDFIAQDQYFVFLARTVDGNPAGFIALYESRALYAEGTFGTIAELFVRPGFRSQTLGRRLLEQARELAHARGWKRLEVTTPPLPQFDKTLAFYQNQGFAITGGRKLKVVL